MKVQLFEGGETVFINEDFVVAVLENADDALSLGIATNDGRMYRIRREKGVSGEDYAARCGIRRDTIREAAPIFVEGEDGG